MAISRRVLLAGSTALGLGGAAAIIAYRLSREPGVAVTAEPGLVGLWRFDENDSDVVRDASGLGNNGIIVRPNGGVARGSGEFAGTVSVGGPDGNFVRIPASPSLNSIVGSVTVVARIFPRKLWTAGDAYDGHIAVVQRQWRTQTHPDLYYLGYGVSGQTLTYKWQVGLSDEEAGFYVRPMSGPPVVGQWLHLAGVFDGATGKVSLYVNGGQLARKTQKGRMRLDPESLERPLLVGGELNGESTEEVSSAFDGYVDEIRIYNRALTGAEVAALALTRAPNH